MERLSTRARIASFALGLGAVFVVAFLLGSAFDPADTDAGGGHGEMERGAMTATEEGMDMDGHGDHATMATEGPAGLAVASGGYALQVDPTRLPVGEERQLRFRVVDATGATVREFDRRHEREMHLIVVRRDGAHFQHLHPEIDAGGTWSVALELPAAGVYRAFADFSAGGEARTLGADLFASGRFEAQPFPTPAPVDRVGGYEVRLHGGEPVAGDPARLSFSVTRGGEPVALEDYLGASGHLVALREGDLAFLHVHPDDSTSPGEIPYEASFPSAGRYRLYLQFKHDGVVRTAEFTLAVGR